MGIRSNKHGKKSDKETQSPLLNVFTEIMERDKRTRQGDSEQRNLITRDPERRKAKSFLSRTRNTASRHSDEQMSVTGGDETDDAENKTFVRNHIEDPDDGGPARAPRGGYAGQRSIHSSRQSRCSRGRMPDDTCSVSCAFKRLAGSEHGCVVCLLLVFSFSVFISCCMVYNNHYEETYRMNGPGAPGSPGSPATSATPHKPAEYGPSLRESNGDAESQAGHLVGYPGANALTLEKRNEPKSDKIKDFYKKLVQTDAKIQYLKQISQLNSPEPNENKPISRLKRSLKWYKYPKRIIDRRYDDIELMSQKSTVSNEADLNDQDDEPRGPTAFVIEKKKMIVKYDPPRKVVPKCSHFQKEYCTQQHEHQLKHPFYQNTQKVDELLDKFLNNNLPEVVTDPFGFEGLFRNNTKSKCKHPEVKSNYLEHQIGRTNKNKQDDIGHKGKSKTEDIVININALRSDNSVNSGTKNKNNRDFRTAKEDEGRDSQKNAFLFTKTEVSEIMLDDMAKGYESKYISQAANMLGDNGATTVGPNDLMSVTTAVPSDKDKLGDVSVAPSVVDPSFNAEYQAPNTRHLMQLNEDEENLGYEDFKEILTDDNENHDDNDGQRERKKRNYENREPDQETRWSPTSGEVKQPDNLDWIHGREPSKAKPPSGVHNPNWKGAMPLYPDEVNSMLKVASEDMLNEKPNSISAAARKSEKVFYKNRPTMSRRQDTFSDVDYIEDYFDNKYGKLAQMAQAYSDYGVLEAKKDVRKEKNVVADLNDSVDKIERDRDKLSRKRRHEDEVVLFGYTPTTNLAHRNEDYIMDSSSWKAFVSKVLGKLVKISNRNENLADSMEMTGLSLSPDFSLPTTTMSGLAYPTMPLTYPIKSPLYNSKMKAMAMKQGDGKDIKASFYEVNKGRALLSTLHAISNNDNAFDNYLDSDVDSIVLDDNKEMTDLNSNALHINKDEKLLTKTKHDVKDLKLQQSQLDVRVFNDSFRTAAKTTSNAKPALNATDNNLPLQQSPSESADFEPFPAERKSMKPMLIKKIFNALGYSKNHNKLSHKIPKPIESLDNLEYRLNVSKSIADNRFQDDMNVAGISKICRNKRRGIVNAKTVHKTTDFEPMMNLHDTIFVANDSIDEDQQKYWYGSELSDKSEERSNQSRKTKTETDSTKSNVSKSVGYRSRVLLAVKEDNANKTEKESEIDIEVSILKNNSINVTKRENKPVPTASDEMTMTAKNESITEKNKHTATVMPKKDKNIKQKVKRNVDDFNLIAWSDIYDDDYGIQTDNFNLNHKEKDNDFIKRSGKWVQEKIRKLAENLKGHDAEVAVKKRSAKDNENPGIVNKPNHIHKRQKRGSPMMKSGYKQMFHNMETNLPLICKNAAAIVQKTRSIEVSEDDTKDVIAASLMEKMVKLMINMVTYHIEQRTCGKLPPDLQRFLLWLTSPEDKTVNVDNKGLKPLHHDEPSPPAHEPLISLYYSTPPKPRILADHSETEKETIQDYFNEANEDLPPSSELEFAQHASNLYNRDFEGMYLNTVQSIQELLDMYNDMKPEDRTRMAGVRLYLQNQLHSLNKMIIKNHLFDSFQKSYWPPGYIRPYKRLQPRNQVKQTSKKHTRTTLNQTISIAVTDRVNVKKKAAIITENAIEHENEITIHNNKRNLQDVYYKAIADAKKFGTRFAKNGHTTQSIKSFTDSPLRTSELGSHLVD